MEGYLGSLPQTESRLLEGIARDEDVSEIKKEYQEKLRFKQYIDFLREGEKSDWWLSKFEEQERGGLSPEAANEVNKILMRRD